MTAGQVGTSSTLGFRTGVVGLSVMGMNGRCYVRGGRNVFTVRSGYCVRLGKHIVGRVVAGTGGTGCRGGGYTPC